jgi:hypothetical protein
MVMTKVELKLPSIKTYKVSYGGQDGPGGPTLRRSEIEAVDLVAVIDLERLANYFGQRAARNKNGSASAAFGAITVKVSGRRPA